MPIKYRTKHKGICDVCKQYNVCASSLQTERCIVIGCTDLDLTLQDGPNWCCRASWVSGSGVLYQASGQLW